MSLRIWLPLTKDLRNQGLDDITITNSGATYLATGGKLGGCYVFDGSDDSIGIGNLSTLVNTDFTFACWFYHDNTWSSKGYETLLGGPSGFELESKVSTTNSPVLKLYNWGGGSCIYELNKWNHVVFTRNTTETKLYLNGELQVTGTAGTIPSGNYFIGAWKTSAQQNFKGNMNDVRIYDHCLSPMEVKELAKGLVLHYPLNRQSFGQENLLLNSTIPTSGSGASGITKSITEDGLQKVVAASGNSNWCTFGNHNTTLALTKGDTFTFSLMIKSDDSIKKPTVYFQSGLGYYSMQGTMSTDWSIIYYTGVWSIDNLATNIHLGFSGAPGTYYIKYFKLEKGDKVTPWAPNQADEIYTAMGLNGTTEYDCSGFCNNGTRNNITYTSDAPKYAVSSTFNGTNSYIKVNDNNWMVKGMSEMTVNLWAKATTWPTNGGRLVSCTESGGFNLEAGNSGYWRFPIYVYTNSGQTSSAYKYDSNEIKIADLIPNEWNMITLVYDNTGTKTYLNGELHHTYTNISYGINFNTNARLFLGCEANTASPYTPYFNGKECDFRIYATALSASDVKSLYQNCATIDPDGTIRGQIRS